MRIGSGIAGYGDYRFWLALFLYGASIPLFFQGGVRWESFHIVMPALVAFIIITTIAWDYRVIGNPNSSFCLILHIAFFISLVFFLNRLIVMRDLRPLADLPNMGGFFATAVKTLPWLGGLYSLFDMVLKSLSLAVILFLVSFALIFRREVALSLLFIFSVLVVAVSVGRNLGPELWSLFGGIAMLAVAFWLQREDEPKHRFWHKVAERLRHAGPRPRIDARLEIALLNRLHRDTSLTVPEICGVLAGKLNCATTDPRLAGVYARVLDQIMLQDGMAEARDGSQGKRLVLAVPDDPPDMFTHVARTMRTIIVLSFCVIYILSPIDFIPDAIPVFGVVDDMLIGGIGLLSCVKTYFTSTRGSDHSVRNLPLQ